ncbi:hypothetical protein G4Z16_19320 [Streptomyces bathyalis]|uniref:Uncharacterized protein n=1 Tax=Streptomyces bathyalis TaxID=2710756 RepID=A0A7T1T865_9ACTN|nr:DUF6226 family protein [Streptomyces bathyalis]QPP08190.1 hypothetical protein G4Z16_19320 [Streptomyces bathyalis]
MAGPAPVGCDACDSGSELLLEDFDSYVLAVVGGEFVHIGRGEDTIVSQGSGWSASGRFAASRRDPERLLRDARSGRSRHPLVRGEPWWCPHTSGTGRGLALRSGA